jgi:hypothetical protein
MVEPMPDPEQDGHPEQHVERGAAAPRRPGAPTASEAADHALAAQRAAQASSPGAAAANLDDDGVGALVTNTGLDGDAASG